MYGKKYGKEKLDLCCHFDAFNGPAACWLSDDSIVVQCSRRVRREAVTQFDHEANQVSKCEEAVATKCLVLGDDHWDFRAKAGEMRDDEKEGE